MAGQQVGVDCFDSSGAPRNRRFIIEYVRGNNLMGVNGQTDANALANGTSVVYQPAVQYDSASGAKVTVIHIDKGSYEIVAAGSAITSQAGGGNGDPQLTTFGSAYVTCGVYDPVTHQPTFYVSGTNAAGHPANVRLYLPVGRHQVTRRRRYLAFRRPRREPDRGSRPPGGASAD